MFDITLMILLLLGAVILALAIGRHSDDNRPQKKRWDDRQGGDTTFKPFDSSSSEPTLSEQVLEGRAYVVDGDSLVINKVQVRLFGVDAPEINHPYGQKSKWALVALCKGQRIKAEITEQDDYGRTVARCYLEDGRDLSAEMVKLGLAIDWPKYSGGFYQVLEVQGIRKKLWLADARQKGRMHVWEKFEAQQKTRNQ
ncbi:MAG: thermonuclease family protein [Hyphomicrobiales bacterium]